MNSANSRSFGGAVAQAGAHERRQFGRRGTNRVGQILVGKLQPVACIIRNVSAGGALLELTVPVSVPKRFALRIEGYATEIACESRHVDGRHVGVQFADARVGGVLLAHVEATDVAPAASGTASAPRPQASDIIHLPQMR